MSHIQFLKKSSSKKYPALHFCFYLFLFVVTPLIFFVQEPNAHSSNIQKTIQPDSPIKKVPLVSRLKNGLTLVVLEDHRFPLVSTRLYVRAGSTYETPKQAGISHILEHMVFKGTVKHPKGDLSEKVEAAGGYINASTSYDYTVYSTDMPAKNWKLGIEAVKDMAFHPLLKEKDLTPEKDVILAELDRGNDTIQNFIFKKVLAKSLAGTPYERPIIGFKETIKATTAQDLRNYINIHYQPQNMVLVVVGDVEHRNVLAEVNTKFKMYQNTLTLTDRAPIDINPLPILKERASVEIIPGAWNKSYIAISIPVTNAIDIQSSTIDVLAQLLGGDKTSLFYRKFKYENNLVDDIDVSNYSFEGLGVLLITAELDSKNLIPFWEAFTKELANLEKITFTQQELDKAKLNLENDLYYSQETLPGLASSIGYFQLFLNGQDGETNTIKEIRNVDNSMLKEAIEKWIRPERTTTVILQPREQQVADLDKILLKNWPIQEKSLRAEQNKQTEVETIQIGEGQTVVLIPDRTLPYYAATLLFSGGDALVTSQEQGLPTLASNTIAKGTSNRTAIEIQDFFASRASDLITKVTVTSLEISFFGPKRFSNDIFHAILDIVKNPKFENKYVLQSINDQIGDIRSNENDPLCLLVYRKMPPFLFPNSVYGYLRLGEIDHIKTYTTKDLKNFWNKQLMYPWVLSIVGTFDRQEVLDFAKALPKPTKEKVVIPPPTWGEKKTLEIPIAEKNQAHMVLLYKTVPDSSPDTPTFTVMEDVLNGTGGILFRDLRDQQGLGYALSAFNRQTPDIGYFAFYIGTEPNKLATAKKGFSKIIKSSLVEALPSEKELRRAKNQIEWSYYRGNQKFSTRAHEAAHLLLLDRPLDYLIKEIKNTLKVTPKDINKLAKQYLSKEDPYIINVLPE